MEIIRNIVIVTSHCEGGNNNLTARWSGAPGTTSPARNNFIGGSLSMKTLPVAARQSEESQPPAPHVMPTDRDKVEEEEDV